MKRTTPLHGAREYHAALTPDLGRQREARPCERCARLKKVVDDSQRFIQDQNSFIEKMRRVIAEQGKPFRPGHLDRPANAGKL